MGRKSRRKIKWRPLDESGLQKEPAEESGKLRVQVKKLSADSPPFVPQFVKDREKRKETRNFGQESHWNDRGHHRISQGPLLLAVPALSLRPVATESRQRHLVAIARGSPISLPAYIWQPFIWYPASTGTGSSPPTTTLDSPRPQPKPQQQEMATKSMAKSAEIAQQQQQQQQQPLPTQPPPGVVSQYYRICTEPETDEIVVHEVEESDSECGSEDVDTLGHRYENNRAGARNGRQVSLATEIFHATEPESAPSGVLGCVTNTHVLRGFYGDPAPNNHGDEENLGTIQKLNLSGTSDTGEENSREQSKEGTPLIFARGRHSIREWLCCHCTIM